MRTINSILAVLFFLFIHFNLNGQHQWPLNEWPVTTPQSQSMNADSLKSFDDAIASGKYGNVDGMIITRNGKLVYQKRYKNDYDSIYGDSAWKKSGLNPHDRGGQYNYYIKYWQRCGKNSTVLNNKSDYC